MRRNDRHGPQAKCDSRKIHSLTLPAVKWNISDAEVDGWRNYTFDICRRDLGEDVLEKRLEKLSQVNNLIESLIGPSSLVENIGI